MRLNLITLCACLLFVSPALAVDLQLPVQGRLTAVGGGPVADGTYPMAFRIYDKPSGGTPLWAEFHLAVNVERGGFGVWLGSVDKTKPLKDTLFAGAAPRYLGVTIGGDKELARQRMALVPRAAWAQSAAQADEAKHATSADLAKSADTAKSAQSALTAKSALTAQSAKTADTATLAQSAKLASTALLANSADVAKTAEVAKSAWSAKTAETAEVAKSAWSAKTAETAKKALNADTAKLAQTATFAQGAKSAEVAKSALSANLAQSANTATSATSAAVAQKALVADSATKAATADSAQSAKQADTALSAKIATTALSAKQLACTGCVQSAHLDKDLKLAGVFSANGIAVGSGKHGPALLNNARQLARVRLFAAAKAPYACDASELGGIYFDTKKRAIMVCDGAVWASSAREPLSICDDPTLDLTNASYFHYGTGNCGPYFGDHTWLSKNDVYKNGEFGWHDSCGKTGSHPFATIVFPKPTLVRSFRVLLHTNPPKSCLFQGAHSTNDGFAGQWTTLYGPFDFPSNKEGKWGQRRSFGNEQSFIAYRLYCPGSPSFALYEWEMFCGK